jgi:hypothetical protein
VIQPCCGADVYIWLVGVRLEEIKTVYESASFDSEGHLMDEGKGHTRPMSVESS